jgi:hypothetical protein
MPKVYSQVALVNLTILFAAFCGRVRISLRCFDHQRTAKIFLVRSSCMIWSVGRRSKASEGREGGKKRQQHFSFWNCFCSSELKKHEQI